MRDTLRQTLDCDHPRQTQFLILIPCRRDHTFIICSISGKIGDAFLDFHFAHQCEQLVFANHSRVAYREILLVCLMFEQFAENPPRFVSPFEHVEHD